MSDETMDSVGWHNVYNEERIRANNLKSERDDLARQLAAERDMLDLYKKTVNRHSEVLSKFFQCGQKYNHFGSWGEDMVDAVPRLVEAYEAERSRVQKLAELVPVAMAQGWRATGEQVPFDFSLLPTCSIAKQLTAILNAQETHNG